MDYRSVSRESSREEAYLADQTLQHRALLPLLRLIDIVTHAEPTDVVVVVGIRFVAKVFWTSGSGGRVARNGQGRGGGKEGARLIGEDGGRAIAAEVSFREELVDLVVYDGSGERDGSPVRTTP
jgi:hypothetical protein